MAKADSPSFDWRYFLSVVHALPLREICIELSNQLPGSGRQHSRRWLAAAAGAIALFFWNGRLCLALGVGAIVTGLLSSQSREFIPLQLTHLQRRFEQLHPSTSLALVGGCTGFITYLATSIWVESQSHWLAAGMLLQGVGTVAALAVLTHHIAQRSVAEPKQTQSLSVVDLTDEAPLRRLIAVRQLTQMAIELEMNHPQRQELLDYLHLMERYETEPLVRAAVRSGCQQLAPTRQLHPGSQPQMRVYSSSRQLQKQRGERIPAHEW